MRDRERERESFWKGWTEGGGRRQPDWQTLLGAVTTCSSNRLLTDGILARLECERKEGEGEEEEIKESEEEEGEEEEIWGVCVRAGSLVLLLTFQQELGHDWRLPSQITILSLTLSLSLSLSLSLFISLSLPFSLSHSFSFPPSFRPFPPGSG